MAEDWDRLQAPGLVHVLITARDERSAYRVYDALVDCFPGVDAPATCPSHHGLIVLTVMTPTCGLGDR